MFEHVGARYYPQFFAKAREVLADDGVMLLHTIGRADGPGATNAWIRKYIFPGGYAPALSEVVPVIEKSGPDRHRCRSAPAALCQDAGGMAEALPGQPRRDRGAL